MQTGVPTMFHTQLAGAHNDGLGRSQIVPRPLGRKPRLESYFQPGPIPCRAENSTPEQITTLFGTPVIATEGAPSEITGKTLHKQGAADRPVR